MNILPIAPGFTPSQNNNRDEANSSDALSAKNQNTSNTSNAEKTTTEKKQEASTAPTKEDVQQLQELKSRDREVRAHEQAHLSAAGSYATSGARLTTERGSDGKQYATSGEVSIDTSPVSGDPQKTIAKAEVIQRAALAPAQPSAQDRSVAAQAAQMETQARAEVVTAANEAVKTEQTDGADDTDATDEKKSENEQVAKNASDNTNSSNIKESPEARAYQQVEQSNQDAPDKILLGVA